LNEFVFRYNRRFYRHVSFEAVLGLAARHGPVACWDNIERPNPRKATPTIRRQPRHRKTASGFRQDCERTSNPADPSSSEEPGTAEQASSVWLQALQS
jgi:hypothetical protein